MNAPPRKGPILDGCSRTRPPGPDRRPSGPRLHGHVGVLRSRRRLRVGRDDPPRARARRHDARHVRRVRARTPTSSSSDAPSPTAASRPCSRPSSGSCAIPRTRRVAAATAAVPTPASRARTRCGASPSTTSTSTTSIASIPRRRSRRPSVRWASSWPRARCVSSASPRPARRRSGAPTRCIRSRRCRPSTRSGLASPRRRSCPRSASWDRLRPVQPARTRLPRRNGAHDRRSRRARLPPYPAALPGRQPARQHLDRRGRRRARTARGVSSAQIALAWVHAQGDDIVPIPGTKRRRYLEENVRALELRLDADELGAARAAPDPRRATAITTCRA